MPSAKSGSLSAEEIIAALDRQIERLTALTDGSQQLGAEQDAASARDTVAKLRTIRDEFLTWLVARAYRRPPHTAQVFNFRRRKIADSAA